MLAFACIHTHDVNYQKKKIQTCVRNIRFYVVFSSKRKKKVTYMPTYSCIYHISIFMLISCYVSIFMQISYYVSIFMHAQSFKLSKRKIRNICLNHHASCTYIIVLFHEMKISCHFWDQNPLHSHERLSNPSVSKRRKKERYKILLL